MSFEQPTQSTLPAGSLEAQHLQKAYGKRQVVKDVSLAVRTGEVVGLLGPNGAGKTTSFYMLVGLVRASAGKLSKTVIGPMLDDKFTEDELKQLVSMLESPVLKKYQGLLPELSNALLEKVVADARPQVTPKLQAAEANVRKILDVASGGKLSAAAAANAQAQGSAPAATATPAAKK